MNKQMWELWFGMEIKMGFGIYEVENKEYGVWGFGFGVLGFGFGVSGLGFRVSGFGFRVSGSRDLTITLVKNNDET